MNGFSISDIYVEQDLRVIHIDPLPENCCSFDCVFCPLGQTALKTDQSFHFPQTDEFIKDLDLFLRKSRIDLVFINPNGEALANIQLLEIINIIHDHGCKVRLLGNGYLLNQPEYKETLHLCDEIIGELAVTREDYFQKLLRPLPGYTLSQHIENMQLFRDTYKGKFILDITILKHYSDSSEAIQSFRKLIRELHPDKLEVETPDGESLKGAFEVDQDRLDEIIQLFELELL